MGYNKHSNTRCPTWHGQPLDFAMGSYIRINLRMIYKHTVMYLASSFWLCSLEPSWSVPLQPLALHISPLPPALASPLSVLTHLAGWQCDRCRPALAHSLSDHWRGALCSLSFHHHADEIKKRWVAVNWNGGGGEGERCSRWMLSYCYVWKRHWGEEASH